MWANRVELVIPVIVVRMEKFTMGSHARNIFLAIVINCHGGQSSNAGNWNRGSGLMDAPHAYAAGYFMGVVVNINRPAHSI